MELTVSDYAVLTVTIASAVVGLFVGVSGALAFLAGVAAASVAGYFAWPLSAAYMSAVWLRGIAVCVLSLLAFGAARWLVKKFVHGLVAQPGDALLGASCSALAGAAISLGAAWGLSLLFPENPEVLSQLLEKILVLIGR